ncbi:MAG: hypothetical protein ACYCZF_11280 [Anaerolineae bacterium]
MQPAEQPTVVPTPGSVQELSTESPSRRGKHHQFPWMGGAILIFIGVVFLIKEILPVQLDNWWALFILIPAFSSFASAWAVYQKEQRLTSVVRGSLIGGLILTCVALFFLFQIRLGQYGWPILLIVAGVVVLLSALIKDKEREI